MQFVLLFLGPRLTTILVDDCTDDQREEGFERLFKTLNDYLPSNFRPVVSELEPLDLLPTLLEGGFFNPLTKYMMHKIFPITEAIENPEYIFGIMIGNAIGKPSLIKRGFMKLLPQVKANFFNGIFSLIVKDPSQEKDIKALCKKINLDSVLALNLINLVEDNDTSSKYNSALTICKKYCASPTIVAGFVALFKNDMSNNKAIAEALEIGNDKISLVLA